jgi:hypothetical protein
MQLRIVLNNYSTFSICYQYNLFYYLYFPGVVFDIFLYWAFKVSVTPIACFGDPFFESLLATVEGSAALLLTDRS